MKEILLRIFSSGDIQPWVDNQFKPKVYDVVASRASEVQSVGSL